MQTVSFPGTLHRLPLSESISTNLSWLKVVVFNLGFFAMPSRCWEESAKIVDFAQWLEPENPAYAHQGVQLFLDGATSLRLRQAFRFVLSTVNFEVDFQGEIDAERRLSKWAKSIFADTLEATRVHEARPALLKETAQSKKDHREQLAKCSTVDLNTEVGVMPPQSSFAHGHFSQRLFSYPILLHLLRGIMASLLTWAMALTCASYSLIIDDFGATERA